MNNHSTYIRQQVGWLAPLAVALLIAVMVLSFKWLGLAMILLGIGFFAFLFVSPLAVLLIWLVLSPIMDFYLRLSLGAGIPDITFTRGVVVGVFFVVLMQSIFRMRRLWSISPTEKSMLAFSAMALFTLLFMHNTTQDLQLLLDGYIVPFILFFLAKNLIQEEKDILHLLKTGAIAGSYLAAVGTLQFFTNINLFVPEGFESIHENRATGPFINAVQYGGVVSVFFLSTFYLYTLQHRGVYRTILVFSLLLMALSVLLSMTRASWGALFLACILIAIFIPKYKNIMIKLPIFLLTGGVVILLMMPGTSAFQERAFELGPIYSRLALYATGLNTALDNPLLGNGFGRYSFFEASRDNLVTFSGISESLGLGLDVPHNEFLHMLVMLGGVGLWLYIYIYYYTIRSSYILYQYTEGKEFKFRKFMIFFWAISMVVILNGLVADFIFFTYFNGLYFLIAGTVMGMISGKDKFLYQSDSAAPHPLSGRSDTTW